MRYQNYENETWITKIELPFIAYIEGEFDSDSKAKKAAIETLKGMKGVLVREGKNKNLIAGVKVFTKWKVYRYTLHAMHCGIYDKNQRIKNTGIDCLDYKYIPGCIAVLKPDRDVIDGKNWCWRYREDTEEGQKEESYY